MLPLRSVETFRDLVNAVFELSFVLYEQHEFFHKDDSEETLKPLSDYLYDINRHLLLDLEKHCKEILNEFTPSTLLVYEKEVHYLWLSHFFFRYDKYLRQRNLIKLVNKRKDLHLEINGKYSLRKK